jgi:hypothetical protein
VTVSHKLPPLRRAANLSLEREREREREREEGERERGRIMICHKYHRLTVVKV